MVVHADETEKVNTLINHIQAYLYQKKEWSPYWENSFAPALCNRIDRNTGGIVIAAKTAEALRVMNQKIRDRELEKLYLCVGAGPSHAERGYAGGLHRQGRSQKAGVHPLQAGARRAKRPLQNTARWPQRETSPLWSATSSPAAPIRSAP